MFYSISNVHNTKFDAFNEEQDHICKNSSRILLSIILFKMLSELSNMWFLETMELIMPLTTISNDLKQILRLIIHGK